MNDSNNTELELNNDQIYTDNIEMYLDEYCISRNITDKYDIRPRQWSAALLYIYQNAFKNDNTFLKHNSSFRGYDLDKVDLLADRYIYLCYDYNQRISVIGFSMFSGIDINTINQWRNGTNKSYIYVDNNNRVIDPSKIPFMNPGDYRKIATKQAKSIYQKLIDAEYNCLADGIQDRKRNPMQTLPLFNQFLSRVARIPDKPVLNAVDVAESLGISDKLQAITQKED